LHVKFAAVYEHAKDQASGSAVDAPSPTKAEPQANPDEISISDDEDFDAPASTAPAAPASPAKPAATATSRGNPDEITLEDDEDEAAVEAAIADAVPANPEEIQISDDEEFEAPPRAPTAPAAQPQSKPAAAPVTRASSSGAESTYFLALDKCGPGKDFIQFLDVPAPERTDADQPPRITFDPHWLAISRAFHPFLSTEVYAPPLPLPDVQAALVADELARIRAEGLLVPSPTPAEDDPDAEVQLVWEHGPVDIGRVQQFWPTAPPEGHPGGSPTAWYTNPQTEAFCGMLGLENKVNPRPPM
jgi:lariat debranching enzyme